MSILATLERGRRLSRSGTAVLFEQQQMTYPELIDAVANTAHGLRTQGIEPGGRVAVLCPNGPQSLIATYGAMAAGAANLPIAATNGWQDVAALLDRFDATALIYDTSLARLVEQVRRHTTTPMTFIRIAGEQDDDVSASCSADLTLGDLLRAGTATTQPLSTPSLGDIAWLGSTGGTTGDPKGVMISWLAINAFLQKWAMEFPDRSPVTLLATPLSHAAGILALGTFARGGKVVITRGIGPDFLSLIPRHRVTETFLPPTAIYKLLEHPEVREHDYSSLRTFLYGAAPISIPRLREAITVFGPVLTQAYGQTECHTLITIMKPADHFVDADITGQVADDHRLSGCGWPTLGTTIEIRNSADQQVPAGEVGQICVRSDLAMTGYYRNPEETARTMHDGFVRTGDVGFIDPDGCLHLVDRQKDLVITGGFNVYPAEIEAVIRKRDAVADCAVVGVADDYWGEALVAVVVPTTGATIDVTHLIADLREECGPVKTPKHILVVNALPQSAIGKVLKNDVRELARQSLTTAVE